MFRPHIFLEDSTPMPSAELEAVADTPLVRLFGPELGPEMAAALYALSQPVPIEDQTVLPSEIFVLPHNAGLVPTGPVYISNRLFPSAHNFFGPETGVDADIADLIGDELCKFGHIKKHTECMDEYSADMEETYPDQFFAAFPQTVALGLDQSASGPIMHDALDIEVAMHDQLYPETAGNNVARLGDLEDLIFTLGTEHVTVSDDSPEEDIHEDYSGLSGSYLIQDNDNEGPCTEHALFALLETKSMPLSNSTRFEAQLESDDAVAERQNREFKKFVNRARAA